MHSPNSILEDHVPNYASIKEYSSFFFSFAMLGRRTDIQIMLDNYLKSHSFLDLHYKNILYFFLKKQKNPIKPRTPLSRTNNHLLCGMSSMGYQHLINKAMSCCNVLLTLTPVGSDQGEHLVNTKVKK
jgi:hypothetical protein